MKKEFFALLLGLLMLGVTVEAKATALAGSDLHAQNLYQGVNVPNYDTIFTVDANTSVVELPFWGYHLTADVKDTGPSTASLKISERFLVSGVLGSSPNLAIFTEATPNMPIFADVTIGSATANWNDPSRLSYTDNAIVFDFGGLRFSPGDFVEFNITTGPSTTPVPEPGTILLLSGGILGIAICKKRKPQQQVS